MSQTDHEMLQSRRRGPPKRHPERIVLTMPEGTIARMDALREHGETRLSMIRTAIETEIVARELAAGKIVVE